MVQRPGRRLKLIKHQMYGRAKFDLLRQRFQRFPHAGWRLMARRRRPVAAYAPFTQSAEEPILNDLGTDSPLLTAG